MQAQLGENRAARRPQWRKLIIGALIALALAAAWRYTPVADFLTPAHLRDWARAARQTAWAPVVLVAAYTPAALVLFPRPVLTLIGVIAFGPWLGVGYAAAGIMLAALATYAGGRVIPYEKIRRLGGAGLDPAVRVLRRHGVMAIFALNQVPAPPFAVQGLISGAVQVKLWQYALGTLLGMAPGLLAWTVFGHQIAAVLEDPSRISWWLVGAVLAAVALLTFLVRRWFARQASG